MCSGSRQLLKLVRTIVALRLGGGFPLSRSPLRAAGL